MQDRSARSPLPLPHAATRALPALLAAGLGLLASEARAQVPYVQSTFTRPYTPLTGATALTPSSSDDGGGTVPIGFSFPYYGVNYTHVNVGVNGVLALARSCMTDVDCPGFGGSCVMNVCEEDFFSTGTSPLPSATDPDAVIAPFWDDLYHVTGGSPPSAMRHQVLGTAPARTFVFEWASIRHYPSNNAGASVSFQVRLQESSGIFEVHYGPFVAGPDSGSYSGNAGWEDPTGAIGGSFFPCATTAGGCDAMDLISWNNTVVQVGPITTAELTGSIAPSTGGNPGDPLVAAVTVRNVGTITATGSFTADVYFSADTTIDPMTDTLLGSVSYADLPANGAATSTLTTTVPAGVMPGYYTIGAIIDAADAVPEATDANNTIVAGIRFLVGNEFSVVMDPVVVAPPGQVSTIPFRIRNEGSALPSVGWALYVSTDATFDMGDTLLVRGASPLPAQPETTITATATLPMIAPGNYYLIGRVDPDNLITEADETNNTAASASFMVGAELGSAVTGPAISGPGEQAALNVTLTNSGSQVGDVEWAVYVSDDRVLDVGDPLVASGTVALGRLRTLSLTVTGTIPTNIVPTDKYFLSMIDPRDVIDEVDDTNNVGVSPDVTQMVGPDLSALDVRGADRFFLGEAYVVEARIRNIGGSTARDFYYSFHLSTNQLITFTDPRIGEFGPLTLAPDEEVSVRHSVTVGSTISAGLYYLGMIVDSRTTVLEGEEANNIRRMQDRQVEVRTPAPDWRVAALSTAANAAAGETMVIQRSLENAGNAPGELAYAVYLSSDATFEPDRDVPLGVATLMLGARALDESNDRFRVPDGLAAGAYHVVYVLDPDGLVDELEEGNNLLISDRTVAIAASQLAIRTQGLPVGTVGIDYDVVLAAGGGRGAYMWTLVDGALPAGLTMSPAGRITGQPRAEGASQFTVQVTDGSQTNTARFGLLVTAPTIGLKLLSRAIPPAWLGRRYEFPLTAIGGVAPYRWRADGILPAGLTLTEAGVLAGTPAVPAGPDTINFRVTDANGAFDERPIVVRVVAADDAVRFSTDTLRDGQVGALYEQGVRAVNGVSPYRFELFEGRLPDGLMLDENRVVGTPSKVGLFEFALRVTDARGDFDVNRYVIEIGAEDQLRFVTNALPSGRVGSAYLDDAGAEVVLKAISPTDNASVRYSIVDGELPPGLTLAEDGKLTGAPTSAGTFDFLVLAIDAQDQTDVAALGIVIQDPPTVLPEPMSDDGCGCTTTPSRDGTSALWLVGLLGLLALRRGARKWACAGLLASAVAMPTVARAQVPYLVSSFSDPYVARTGGTALRFSSQDDGSSSVMLPFPFTYFGTPRNQLLVSTNGYVTFGTSGTSFSNGAIPGTSQPNDMIALWWDDLTTPTAETYVEGTAPSRVFIIQYTRVTHLGGNPGVLAMQLWLYEGAAGRFELRYGPVTGASGSWSGSIGYEDGTGMQGQALRSCTPTCNASDITALGNTGYRVMADGGTDAVAAGITGPNRVFAGLEFDTQVTIASLHMNPIGPFHYQVHVVRAAGDTPMEPVFTSTTPITLGPYEVRTLRAPSRLPVTTAPGRYRLALVVDPADDLMEPDENNNLAYTTEDLVVAERRPNLRIAALSASPATAQPGGTIDVNVRVENAGNLPASSDWSIVLSTNRIISVDDLVLHEGMATLGMLESVTATVSVTLPADLPAGRYYVGALADRADAVLELDELDNVGRAADPIAVGVDFVRVDTSDLPGAWLGQEYASFLSASGGDGSYSWAVTAGDLPPGLGLLSASGELRGNPTMAGSFPFTVTVTSAMRTATAQLTLVVREIEGRLTIVNRSVLPGVVGQDYPPAEMGADPRTTQILLAVGNQADVSFRLLVPAPAGLTLDADGFLHGVPQQRGVFDLAVEATDGTQTATRTIPLTVTEPGRLALVAATLPDGTVEEPYQFRLQVLGKSDTASASFSLVGGANVLPPGLALTQDGLIVGVPTEVGVRSFAVRVVEGSGVGAPEDTANFRLEILADAGFGISPSSLPPATLGQAYEAVLEPRGGVPPFTWRVTPATEIPRGLRFEIDSSGPRELLRFLGTPEVVPTGGTGGLASMLIAVEDASGRVARRSMSIRVVEPPRAMPIQPTDDGGCVCVAAPRDGSGRGLALLALLGLSWFVRRRRPGSR